MSAIAFQEWLNSGQEYAAGVALYSAHPAAKTAVVRLLQAGGPGSFTTRKLVEEISALAASERPKAATPLAPRESPADVPADVAALVAERVALFKEASNLQSTLRLLATKEERFAAACTIRQNFSRIDEIWSALKYHEQHGHLPPVVPVVSEDDAAAQYRRLTTLRTYISSKRGTDDKRKAWAAEIADLERRLGK